MTTEFISDMGSKSALIAPRPLSWVLPALILFTDVEVHKMVIFCCFLPFLPQFEVQNDTFLRELSKLQKQIFKI